MAKIRNLPLTDVSAAIARNTSQRQLGVLGEPTVNVLTLNRDLDATAKVAP